MSHNMKGESETPINKKDMWNTTWQAVRDAECLIGGKFGLDACATSDNESKAASFISKKDDAMITEWNFLRVFCNPPFSRKIDFIDRAYQQAKKHKNIVCMLIPFEPCTKWWRERISGKATAVYIPDGRYNFIDYDTKEEIKGVPFCSCFVVFTSLNVPTQYIEFNRGCGGK